MIPLRYSCVKAREAMFESYFENALIAWMNIIPVLLIGGILYLIFNRAWVSSLLTGALCLGLGFVNFFKVLFRSEPVNFEDVTLFQEALNMTGRGYDLFLEREMIYWILFVVGCTLFLFLFAGGKNPGMFRLLTLAALFVGWQVYMYHCADKVIYEEETRNDALINKWSENEEYYSKGLVYPFLHSYTTYGMPAPAGYSEAQAAKWLAAYDGGEIPAERQVDVICIMLEAYSDFEDLGVEGIAEPVYAPLRQIQAESISGNLITNIFAGNTINTERAFLSGYVRPPSFRGNTSAYPWFFREQGYRAEGSHASFAWFYNRENVTQNMGFSDYYFLNSKQVGRKSSDYYYLPRVLALYDEHCAETEQPYFSYHLTYQGHGPYVTTWLNGWGNGFYENEASSDEAYYALNNYLGGIKSTGLELTAVLNELRGRERPVVVVAFGDHKPWMGDANSIYEELGVNMDPGTNEGYRNYYSTPYFIWGNDAAKSTLGTDLTGDGGEIAPAFLMHVLFEACGWTGPAYMQATDEIRQEVPVPTDKGVYILADGSIGMEEPEAAQKLSYLEHYMKTHFVYDEVASEDTASE